MNYSALLNPEHIKSRTTHTVLFPSPRIHLEIFSNFFKRIKLLIVGELAARKRSRCQQAVGGVAGPERSARAGAGVQVGTGRKAQGMGQGGTGGAGLRGGPSRPVLCPPPAASRGGPASRSGPETPKNIASSGGVSGGSGSPRRGPRGPGAAALAWSPATALVPDVCCPEEPGRSHCPNLTRPDPVGPAGPCEAPEVPRAKAQWPQPPGRLQPTGQHPPTPACRPLGTRDGAWGRGGCMWRDGRRFRAVSGGRQ